MPELQAEWIDLFYLVAAVLFILALKDMSHPRTAVRGNLLGSSGMLLAIIVTLTDHRIVSFEVIIAGIVVGALIGAFMAYRAPLTAMPQVVAVFNGFGGGASALAVGAALEEALKGGLRRGGRLPVHDRRGRLRADRRRLDDGQRDRLRQAAGHRRGAADPAAGGGTS